MSIILFFGEKREGNRDVSMKRGAVRWAKKPVIAALQAIPSWV
jgi:hypothetical protein